MASPEISRVSRLASDIEQIPSGVQASVRKGFSVASTLTSDDIRQIIGFAIQQVEEGANFDSDSFSKRVNVTVGDANQLFMSIAVTLGLLAENPVSAEEFVEAGRDKIFDGNTEAVASLIAGLVTPEQRRLKNSISRQQLASAVMPALRSFTSAVDLRIRFDDTKLEEYVAVALVNIDTDVDGNQLIMQLTKYDVNNILEKLQEISKQMEKAEELIKNSAC